MKSSRRKSSRPGRPLDRRQDPPCLFLVRDLRDELEGEASPVEQGFHLRPVRSELGSPKGLRKGGSEGLRVPERGRVFDLGTLLREPEVGPRGRFRSADDSLEEPPPLRGRPFTKGVVEEGENPRVLFVAEEDRKDFRHVSGVAFLDEAVGAHSKAGVRQLPRPLHALRPGEKLGDGHRRGDAGTVLFEKERDLERRILSPEPSELAGERLGKVNRQLGSPRMLASDRELADRVRAVELLADGIGGRLRGARP